MFLRFLMMLRGCERQETLSLSKVALDALACHVHVTARELSHGVSIFSCLLKVMQSLLFVHLDSSAIVKTISKITLSSRVSLRGRELVILRRSFHANLESIISVLVRSAELTLSHFIALGHAPLESRELFRRGRWS